MVRSRFANSPAGALGQHHSTCGPTHYWFTVIVLLRHRCCYDNDQRVHLKTVIYRLRKMSVAIRQLSIVFVSFAGSKCDKSDRTVMTTSYDENVIIVIINFYKNNLWKKNLLSHRKRIKNPTCQLQWFLSVTRPTIYLTDIIVSSVIV